MSSDTLSQPRWRRPRILSVSAAVLVAVVGFGAARRTADLRQTQAIRRDVGAYVHLWIAGDYPGMYDLLSSHTRALMPLDVFSERSAYAASELAAPLELLRVTVLRREGRCALVEYETRTRITARQAAYLTKLGRQATAGESVSRSRRWFVLERGRWRMFIIPRERRSGRPVP